MLRMSRLVRKLTQLLPFHACIATAVIKQVLCLIVMPVIITANVMVIRTTDNIHMTGETTTIMVIDSTQAHPLMIQEKHA